MNNYKTTGLLLLLGAIGVLLPYIVLTITFEYPQILRQETGIILTKFEQGGSSLLFTWWLFAFLGLPLLIAYVRIGQQLEVRLNFMKWATTIGVISILVQMIGLLRWVFVVPVIAHHYTTTNDAGIKNAAALIFHAVHQFGGVLLGEHIGQLFTIIWTIAVSSAFRKLKIFPEWISWLGIAASLIYVLAQAELFATVMPRFPVWDSAGFIGSTLWLIWLIIVGTMFLRHKTATG